jgi:glycosyltransferase involved in cell wall biosynthesis
MSQIATSADGKPAPSPKPDGEDATPLRYAVPPASLEGRPPRSAYANGLEPPSVLILTKNEEVNIAACIETLTFSDDIVVLDSFSNDKTLEIAARYPNVRIIQRKFDTWSRHSNWALDNIAFKHPWVYYSDADERVTPELRDEVLRTINSEQQPHGAFRVRYKNMFLGSWIKHGGVYPVWIIRLFRPDSIRYEDREVNAHPQVRGTLGDLKEHFIHYSFNKGLSPWFTKHNSYSEMEANEAVRIVGSSTPMEKMRKAFDKDPGVKRRAVKDLSFFLPLRGFIRFAHMYFWKMGFRDGVAGFHYAAMISMYEYWIELKIREKQRRWRDETDAEVKRNLMADMGGVPEVESKIVPLPTGAAGSGAVSGGSSGATAARSGDAA